MERMNEWMEWNGWMDMWMDECINEWVSKIMKENKKKTSCEN